MLKLIMTHLFEFAGDSAYPSLACLRLLEYLYVKNLRLEKVQTAPNDEGIVVLKNVNRWLL